MTIAATPRSTRTPNATIASLRVLCRAPGGVPMADAVDTIPDIDPRRSAMGLGAHLDRAIGRVLETSTAALVVAEIVILFVGILARYVFHRPLVWSDELASILFLWLAVLGAALAFRRGENLRMTTLVNKLPLPARRQFEAVALATSLAFLAM